MNYKENQHSEESENKRGLELGGSGGFSIFNDSYPFFLAYDLTRNLKSDRTIQSLLHQDQTSDGLRHIK